MSSRPRRIGRILGTTLIMCIILEGAFTLLGVPLLPLALYASAYNGVQSVRGRWVPPLYRWRQRAAERTPPDPAVVDAVNGFGFRLLREAANARPGDNILLSPSAVASVLSLTANGADGPTRDEMLKCLGLDRVGLEAANAAFRDAAGLRSYADSKVQVSSAMSLWVDAPAAIRPEFLQVAGRSYDAQAESLDLQSSSAPHRINGWLRDKTHGRLSDAAQSFGSLDRLAIVDALYFHGEWTTKFKTENTRPAPFFRLDGSEAAVDMMHGRPGTAWLRTEDLAAVRIPYGAGTMALYIFVPRVVTALPAWLESLTTQRWKTLLGQMVNEEVAVGMPRFHVESEPPLKAALQRTGMRRAFSAADADFSRLSNEPLSIGSIRHKTLLDVDENGTTAAAMVVELMVARGKAAGILVDRPFFLAIRDDRTGLVLLEGAVYDPRPLTHGT